MAINIVDSLTYKYICGNLTDYLFSTQMTTGSKITRQQELQNFENSLNYELFVRRNKRMAHKIIEEIKFERVEGNRKLFFITGVGKIIDFHEL